MMPLLLNHDQSKALGVIKFTPSSLIVRFHRPMSRKEIFEIFGNCGFRGEHTPRDADVFSNIEIFEWSVPK